MTLKFMSCISAILISALLGCAIFLPNSNVSADVANEVIINVPVACTMSDQLDEAHSATINPGQSAEDIGTTTFTVFCNDSSGYAIYAIGYSNTEHGNTNLLPSDSANPSIATGLATSGNTSAWAMKLIPVTTASSGTTQPYTPTIENSYDDYNLVPNTYTKVATFTSNTDFTIGSSLKSTYRAHISGLQAADTYTGKVRYTLVHPANGSAPLSPQVTDSDKICYYPNGSNVVGTMGCQTITSNDTSATLLASNFSREGYGFAGWSTTFDYSDSTGFYGPQEDITFTAGQYTDNNPGLSLYAHWVESDGDLQSWTGCSSLQRGAVTALTDQRDNDTYAVAKLADDNCWMIENLRLDSTAAHNSDGTLAQGYRTSSTYGNFSGLANAENDGFTATNFDAFYSSNSLYSTNGRNNTINIGTSDAAYRMPRYNNLNNPDDASNRPQNPTSNTFTSDNTTAGLYSYGNYYTWSAAIANTIYYSNPATTDADGKTSETSNTSLCPTGWKLPRGGNKSREATNDFWALIVTGINNGTNPENYDSSTTPFYRNTPEGVNASKNLRAYPNNFLYSGFFSYSSAYSRGYYGLYWSSTSTSYNDSYHLSLYNNTVYPGTQFLYKYQGYSIRCVMSNNT